MSSTRVETITESVVREYLSRKGLVETLRTMDEECPRKSGSIRNRGELARTLNIEQLIQANKTSSSPLRSTLEVITQHLLTGTGGTASHITGSDRTAADTNSNEEIRSQNTSSKGSSSQSDSGSNHHHHGDITLDDHLDDGETFLGDGKAGLMGKQMIPPATDSLYMGGTGLTPGGRIQKPAAGRIRGGGPISSNLDDREKQRRMRMKNGPSLGRTPISTDTDPPLVFNKTPQLSDDFLLSDSTSDFSSHSPKNKNKFSNGKNDNLDKNFSRKSSVTDKKRLEDILSADANSRLNKNQKPALKPEPAKNFTESDHVVKTSKIQPPKQEPSKNFAESDLVVKTSKIQPRDFSRGYEYVPTKDHSKSRELLMGGKSLKSKKSNTTKLDDLELGDIDDLDEPVGNLEIGSRMPLRQPTFVVDSKPIDIQTAIDLKTLVLGSAQQVFNAEWKYQSFTFCDLPSLLFGFVQKKGGPCGVLASVQACFLQELLFKTDTKPTMSNLKPSRHKRSELLAAALATILWRCGDETSAVVTVPDRTTHFPGSSRIKLDNLTETLMVNTFTNKPELETFLHRNISQFELDGSSGVILALYSAILSRTIPGVRSDMDEPNSTLMGAHGYCTQDMVNLLLTGHAASNIFNDNMELDGADGEVTILKGIRGRSEIGLLSLFEHYKSCQVGSYLKTPLYPIWVICSESHFSVLFSLRKELLSDWKAEKRFDLFYYDGLGKQDEEIRLSIDTTNTFYEAPKEGELIPPLEHCIRTKWADAEIDWNGSDPLL